MNPKYGESYRGMASSSKGDSREEAEGTCYRNNMSQTQNCESMKQDITT